MSASPRLSFQNETAAGVGDSLKDAPAMAAANRNVNSRFAARYMRFAAARPGAQGEFRCDEAVAGRFIAEQFPRHANPEYKELRDAGAQVAVGEAHGNAVG